MTARGRAAAGQYYRSKAARGHRYIRIMRIVGDVATCREVSRVGTELTGRDRMGFRRVDFYVALQVGAMPLGYETWEP